MSSCLHTTELSRALRAGQWPQGCSAELRDHVATCDRCTEQLHMLVAFAAAREGAMRAAPKQSAELLWWKAQLRRRHEAMQRLENPSLALPALSIFASVIVLATVLASAWRHINWSHVVNTLTPATWNVWVVAAIAVVLCGFITTVVVIGFDRPEERT